MEHAKKIMDADSGEEYTIKVEPGPLPNTIRIVFGSSFTIILRNEDASGLAGTVLLFAQDSFEKNK
jgi:hypothetical protein